MANQLHRRLILIPVAKLRNYETELFFSSEIISEKPKLEMSPLKKAKELVDCLFHRSRLSLRDMNLYQKSEIDLAEVPTAAT